VEQDEMYHRVKQDLSSDSEDFIPYLFQGWDMSWKTLSPPELIIACCQKEHFDICDLLYPLYICFCI